MSKAPPPRILSGDEVMEFLGLGPGPAVGEALRLLEEEVEAGEIATPDEARAFLREWWDSGGGDEESSAGEDG